jgi:hypothetical protein
MPWFLRLLTAVPAPWKAPDGQAGEPSGRPPPDEDADVPASQLANNTALYGACAQSHVL